MSEINESVRCPECGAENSSGSNFCGNCGYRLRIPSSTLLPTEEARLTEKDESAHSIFGDSEPKTSESPVLHSARERDDGDDGFFREPDYTDEDNEEREDTGEEALKKKISSFNFNSVTTPVAFSKEASPLLEEDVIYDGGYFRVDEEDDGKVSKKRSLSKTAFTGGVMCGLITMLLSIALLLTILFLPISHSDLDYKGKDEWSVELSGIDGFILAYYSIESLNDTQIKKSLLYRQTVKEYTRIINSGIRPSRMSFTKQARLEELTQNMLCLALSSDYVDMPVELAFAVGAIAVTVVICSVMAISATVFMFKSLLASDGGDYRSSGAFSTMAKSAWLLVTFIPLTCYLFYQTSYFGKNNYLIAFSSAGCGLSYGAYIAIVLAVACVTYTVVCLALSKPERFKTQIKLNKKSVIAVLVGVAMAVSAVLPWFAVNVAEQKGRRISTEKCGIGITEIHNFNDADADYYFESSSSDSETILRSTIKELFDSPDQKKQLGGEIINLSIFGVYRYDISLLYGLIFFLAVLQFIFSGALFGRGARNILLGENEIGRDRALRVFVALTAIVQTIVAISILIILKIAINEDLSYVLAVKCGIGPILSIIFAVIMFMTLVRTKSERKIEEGYDNADVSYAPYVLLGGRK